MIRVDAHCHVDLMADPARCVEAAEAARIYTIAVTNAPSVFEHTHALCVGKRYVRAAVGLHPELVHSHGGELGLLVEQLKRTRYVGEVGLDYVTGDTPARSRQRSAFAEIAAACGRAGGRVLSIHSRRAVPDVLAILREASPGTAILHWFSGTRRQVDEAVGIGCFFSVNPAMAASRAGRALLAAMPRDRVVTETDGPFVCIGTRPAGPDDVRGVVQALGELWGATETEAGAAVAHTFKRIVSSCGEPSSNPPTNGLSHA